MHCRKARKIITAYLAGECRSSETKALEKHLDDCSECAAELEEMRRFDGALALWRVEPAPAGLWDAVMSEVGGISRTRGMAGAGDLGRYSAGAGRAATGKVRPELLLRDLVVAAAVSIVFSWGGVWPAGERMLSAGESINGAVSAYVRFTADVMERASGTTEEYTRKIIFEEWKK